MMSDQHVVAFRMAREPGNRGAPSKPQTKGRAAAPKASPPRSGSPAHPASSIKEPGNRWGGYRLLGLFFDLPIFYKIFLANLLAIGGGVCATLLLAGRVGGAAGAVETGLTIAGVLLAAGNAFLLRLALSPLAPLQKAVDAVLAGDFTARARTALFGDPVMNRLADAFNRMLDRIEVYTRTIERERAQSRRLAGRVLSAQEDERKRIARELHDQTGQILAALMIGLETVYRAMPGSGARPEECEKCRGRVAHLMEIADSTLEEVHRLAFNLRPSVLDDLGLVEAVKWLLREYLDKVGIRTDLFAEGLAGRLPPEIEVAAFRIAQEACTNVVKYAKAERVRMGLIVEDGSLHLLVEDDGVGFRPEEVEKRGREDKLGLFGMAERAYLLGGVMEVESTPGRGTRIRTVLPLGKEPR